MRRQTSFVRKSMKKSPPESSARGFFSALKRMLPLAEQGINAGRVFRKDACRLAEEKSREKVRSNESAGHESVGCGQGLAARREGKRRGNRVP